MCSAPLILCPGAHPWSKFPPDPPSQLPCKALQDPETTPQDPDCKQHIDISFLHKKVLSIDTNDSPFLTINTYDSPCLTTRTHDSPFLTSNTHDSPFLTTSTHDSPLLTTSTHDSPRLTTSTHDSPFLTTNTHDSPCLTINPDDREECQTRGGCGRMRSGVTQRPTQQLTLLTRTAAVETHF